MVIGSFSRHDRCSNTFIFCNSWGVVKSFKEIPGCSIIMVFIVIPCLKIHTFHKSWNSLTLYSIFIHVNPQNYFPMIQWKFYSPEKFGPKNLDIQHNREKKCIFILMMKPHKWRDHIKRFVKLQVVMKW